MKKLIVIVFVCFISNNVKAQQDTIAQEDVAELKYNYKQQYNINKKEWDVLIKIDHFVLINSKTVVVANEAKQYAMIFAKKKEVNNPDLSAEIKAIYVVNKAKCNIRIYCDGGYCYFECKSKNKKDLWFRLRMDK